MEHLWLTSRYYDGAVVPVNFATDIALKGSHSQGEEIGDMNEIHAIVAVVERGKADVVVDKAKQSGAAGATILFGRGTGQEEVQKMFHHLHVESSKEIILILCREFEVENILNAIVEAGKLRGTWKGYCVYLSRFQSCRVRIPTILMRSWQRGDSDDFRFGN